MRPDVLVRVPFPPESIALLEEDFVVHYAPTAAEFENTVVTLGPRVRAVVTSGSLGLDGELIAAMPGLEIIHSVGAGFEQIDLSTARAKGIKVAHNVGANASSVAEHAMALLLAVTRNIVAADQAVRAGRWKEAWQPRPEIAGKTLGVIGLGVIGMRIAKRAEAFETRIVYHNRNRRDDVAYTYAATPLDLAVASDILVICAPGGPETHGMVDRAVLEALGPSGILINVGRGTIVDTDAMVEALETKMIAGAGLDVWAGEPAVPQSLKDAPNVVLSPHVGGRSPESIVAARSQISRNLKAHFAGGEVLHRVV